jgi:nicotinamidase-related amidase
LSPVFILINPTGDFFHADGAVKTFATARAARLLIELYRAARKACAPVILVRNVHAPDDKECAETGGPAHGVAGTSGAEFIPELCELGAWAVPSCGKRRPWIAVYAWRAGKAPMILEKNTLNVATNPALEELLCGIPAAAELAVGGLRIAARSRRVADVAFVEISRVSRHFGRRRDGDEGRGCEN